jgi:hypothetical protein
MTAGDHAWVEHRAGLRTPGPVVVSGVRGGCRIRLDRPLVPLVIAAVLREVARYPLDDTLTVPCDVRAAPRPDTRLVDTLARLCLGLKRQGRRLRVEGASPELRELLALCGLDDVIPCRDALP